MALQSSRLCSLWTNIVKVSNTSGTFGASTTTVYMVRRTAVQIRNFHYVTTYTRTQQLLSVRKMIGQPTKLMSGFAKLDPDECAPKKPKSSDACEESSSFKVVNTDNPVMGKACGDSANTTTTNAPTTASTMTRDADDGNTGRTRDGAPTSGFCAGISPDPAKENTSDGFKTPEVKLPDRDQVEKYFFRSLAFIYDVAMVIMNWMRKLICKYIIMNDKVQAHWQNLRNKMEDSKRN